MTVALPDTAVLLPTEDRLGRDRFANSLAQLVVGAPDGSNLRIGIYGGWGSGKTSVLKLAAYHVKAAKQHTVWLLPWAFSSTRECYRYLVLSIAKELGIRTPLAQTLYGVQSRISGVREAVRGNLKAAIADSVLGTTVDRHLSKWADKRTDKLLAEIRERLKGRKLLVLVDDLDRLNPDDVPGVLLTLRELLDEPNIYYMLAMSPTVVQAALEQAHPGWGNSLEFLEKVIELPRFLPEPSDEEWLSFLDSLKATVSNSVSKPAFDVAASYLPRNPRKAKLYVRYLGSLTSLFERFSPLELDWLPFLLAQMLLLEFPEETMSMARAPKVIENIELHGFGIDDGQEKGKAHRPEEEYAPRNEPARKRFLYVCGALRARMGLIRGMYSLRQMFTLHEVLPVATWGELESLLERVSRDGTGDLDKWVNLRGHAERRGRMRGLFHMLVRARENTLGAAAEAQLEVQLLKELEVADSIMLVMRHVALERVAFASSDLIAEHWFALLGHIAQWSHFDNLAYYTERRAAERAFLIEVAATFPEDTAAEVLGKLEMGFDTSTRKKSPAFADTLKEITRLLSQKLAGTVQRCFEEPEGIEQFWAQRGSSGLRYLMFNPQSLLHKEHSIERLLVSLLPRAREDGGVQRNYLTFLRMLVYGGFEGGSFSRTDSQTLLRNLDLLGPLWRGATGAPLNPRTTGSLREDRVRLLTLGIPAETVPLPEWWQKLEDTFFAKLEDAPLHKELTQDGAEEVEDPQ